MHFQIEKLLVSYTIGWKLSKREREKEKEKEGERNPFPTSLNRMY